MFQNIFGRKDKENLEVSKIFLTEEDHLDVLLDASNHKPVLLFKHSSSCGISAMVLKRFESKLKDRNDVYHYYFLDLLRYRNISNLITKKLNVLHQSPQLILIKNGKVVDHSSHYGIMDIEI